MWRALVGSMLVIAACSAPVTSASTSPSTPATAPASTVPPATVLSDAPSTTAAVPSPAPERGTEWFVASVTASLPEGLGDGLLGIEGVEAVSVARVGLIDLIASTSATGEVVDEARRGYAFPLEAHAFDPAALAAYAPDVADLLASLAADEVLLSASSAAFRGLGTGATLLLATGNSLTVAGVVDDEWVGSAEVVTTHAAGLGLGVVNERYAVVRFTGPRDDLERQADALVEESVRIRSREQVDVFRHADAVAAQITIKQRFGEFAYRPAAGGAIEIDPEWLRAHIVREEIPLLGEVTCHVEFMSLLREAMAALVESGHGDVIDPMSFMGCHKARFIRERSDLSRHAWGVAADINFGNPLDDVDSPAAPELVAAMAAVGIGSGHSWTDPGPGHFEWRVGG